MKPRYDPNDDRMTRMAASVPSGPEELNEFNLFCAYHLGVTRTNGYKFQSLKEVASRFAATPAQIKRKLLEFGLDTETLRGVNFETEYYQLDIKVAPEGVSRRELGRSIWEELLAVRGPAPGLESLPPIKPEEAIAVSGSDKPATARTEEAASSPDPVEAPAEEVTANEASAEEALAEEVTTEAPAEEVTAEEAPVEEATAEEAPVETEAADEAASAA